MKDKIAFEFDDKVVPVNEDDSNLIMKISKIEKNDDNSFSYFCKATNIAQSDGNVEYGPFAEGDLKPYKETKKK